MRAGQKNTASHSTIPPAPQNGSLRGGAVAALEADPAVAEAVRDVSAEVVLNSAGTFITRGASKAEARTKRHRELASCIRQRIESRLPGRVRNLTVRVSTDTVVLEGRCATYYSKQLAQHAALGILDDEQLENAIVVDVPR